MSGQQICGIKTRFAAFIPDGYKKAGTRSKEYLPFLAA